QKQFEKALYSIEENFPPGKLPGKPEFASKYFNMSQGEGDTVGPWNNEEFWEVVSDRDAQAAVDGGDGLAAVKLTAAEKKAMQAVAARSASDPSSNPTTGAELGAGTTDDGGTSRQRGHRK
ncbi:MAG: Mn-containing catalase, partial [Rhodospirillales bacterium]|nr:Mn-containing catalase [Rhodospirillales bacterium]